MTTSTDLKKGILSMCFSKDLFNYMPDGWSDFVLMNFVEIHLSKPFYFYEENFQYKTVEEIKEDLSKDEKDEKDGKDEKDEENLYDLWFIFDNRFNKFSRTLLEANEFSENKPSLEELFGLFEDMYYSYKRFRVYRTLCGL